MTHTAQFGPLLLAALVTSLIGCSRPPATQNTQTTTSPRRGGLGRVVDVPPGPSCMRERPPATLEAGATPSECRSDADCITGRNGRCLRLSNHGSHGPSLEATRCSYDACFADNECGPRETCACAARAATEVGEGHRCAPGDCASDADCGTGRYCRRSAAGRFCHSPQDECVEETVCASGTACQREPRLGIYRCLVLPSHEMIVGMR